MLFISGVANSQICSQTIYPHVVSQGVGSFHVTADTTMPYNDGSDFYVCAGVHLTMTGSAGSNYVLEDGASLTLMDHGGDNVFAKSNCTITDYSTETLVVTGEANTTISKPNDAFNFVFMTCPSMVYDYSLVGGSAPCSVLNVSEIEKAEISIFPNPVNQTGVLNFGVELQSFELIDLSGRVVQSNFDLNSDYVNLEGVEKGVFIARMQALLGEYHSERIIVL